MQLSYCGCMQHLTDLYYCLLGGGPEKLIVMLEGEALLNDASGELCKMCTCITLMPSAVANT